LGNAPFLTPLFLLGAATAAIPVILHMIYRVRAPKLLFSTLRFLKIAADKTAHRRRIQNWLLLLLRMLLFAGLAMGLGNLVGCEDTRAMLGAGKKTAAVLVVDNSFSMRMRLPKGAGEQVAAGTRYQRAKAFGTPWALSEMDHLCVYDANLTNRGVYWIDANGNRELIYRDPEINALSPIPFRPRPRPPVIPDRTVQTARAIEAAGGDVPPSTVSVVNVYDSSFAWPEGTQIEALRVIQVLPKTTPSPNRPRVGVANQTNARRVLGTVPVEPDGSVYFEAPHSMQIYFQTLDGQGRAVQSMRSGTYLHPGEHLSCQGCHEPKQRQTPPLSTMPLAMRRSPSKIEPGPEGSSPFNYAQLVQPVLDRHCVDCHRKEKALDLSGAPQGDFTVSYNNLAKEYGFYFESSNGSIKSCPHGGSRTIAGEFGSLGAPLRKYLDRDHYGVDMPPEDLARINLWLDCNSEFLGAYEQPEAQQRGEPVEPSLD